MSLPAPEKNNKLKATNRVPLRGKQLTHARTLFSKEVGECDGPQFRGHHEKEGAHLPSSVRWMPVPLSCSKWSLLG